MSKWICLVVALLVTAFSVPMRAQHGMHVGVVDGRINIGSEFVPRCAASTNGTLAAGTHDCIEVSTALTIPAVEVKIQTLIVLPGATLTVDCGATIIGRNVAIDTKADPFTWGNGLLNFGTLRMVCPPKAPFAALTGPAADGATTITADRDLLGWAAGDELVLPDTRQMGSPGSNNPVTPTRETGTTIAAINGRTVTLSKPLAFARDSIKRPDGSVVLQPRVANLGRQTVIKSEAPNGTRWHIAMVGGATSWDVQGVQFVGLGRTRNETLNSTPATDLTRIGTNQIGRYAFHMHHVASSLAVRRIDSSSFNGMNGGKWSGPVVHQSHDIEITNNVCVDAPGSCFVTEDGNEVRNVFRGNFAAYVKGNGKDARVNTSENCRGCESAFWFGGLGNIIEGNEAWNSQSSIDLFNQAHLASGLMIPSVKGGPLDTMPNLMPMVPISVADNVTASNTDSGFEYWTVSRFPNLRLISAHNGAKNVWNGQADGPSAIFLVDPIVIGSSQGTRECIASSIGYNGSVETERGEVRGCQNGVSGGIGREFGKFTETVFQNYRDFWFEQGWPPLTLTRVRFEQLRNEPKQFFAIPQLAPEWSGPPVPLPTGDARSGWQNFGLSNIQIIGWQGGTQNYRLVGPAQRREALAWSDPADYTLPPPECGATLGETWDKCGMANGGQPFASGEAVALEGVLHLVAVPEPRPPVGPPHAVMTAPSTRLPATLSPERPGTITGVVAFSGDNSKADNQGYFSIDGGPRQVIGRNWLPSYQWFSLNVITPGTHSVRTWRELNGVEVAGSSLTFGYCVGACGSEPPPPPPPDPCVVSPLAPTVSVTAPGHTLTWSGTVTATDERGCRGTVSQ